MALYVPAGRRKRNVVIALVGALILGLIIGGVVGRASAPGISDEVSSVQDSARQVTARLQATPNEYRKQLSGSTEFAGGGTVVQSLGDARTTLLAALDDAVWMGPAQRKQIEDAFDDVLTAAKAKVAADVYQKAVDDAATTIDAGFGIDAG